MISTYFVDVRTIPYGGTFNCPHHGCELEISPGNSSYELMDYKRKGISGVKRVIIKCSGCRNNIIITGLDK